MASTARWSPARQMPRGSGEACAIATLSLLALAALACEGPGQLPQKPSTQSAPRQDTQAPIAAANATSQRRGFLTFSDEVDALKRSTGCADEITPALPEFGALFGCIRGDAQTAKLFVNQVEGSDRVENVKVMWNDWYRDTGHGLHPDKREARVFVEASVDRYAPGSREELLRLFFESTTEKSLTVDPFTIRYTYVRGPAIDERLLTFSTTARD